MARTRVMFLVFLVAIATSVAFGVRAYVKTEEASASVAHSRTVQIAIARTQLRLAENASTVASDFADVCALTADNPVQRTRCASPPTARGLVDMMATEDALLASRQTAFERAKTTSLALGIGAFVAALIAAGVLVVLRDKQRRAFEAQSAFFTSLLESIADPIVAASPSGKIVVANAGARSLFPGARVGTSLDVVGEALRSAEGANVSPRESRDRMLVSVGEDERRKWLTVTSRAVRDSSKMLIGSVAVYRDVTTEKKHADDARALAVTDPLTGCNNRRGFFLLAEQHARLAARTRSPFTVLFADLDGLKHINDRFGHEVGDEAIAAGAGILRTCLRESDIVARLGGDELVALIVHADGSAIAELSTRIHRAVTRFNAAEDRPWTLAMSLGSATFDPSAPQTLNELVAEADRRMYRAKRAPRHASITSGTSDTSTSSADRALAASRE